VLRYAIKHAVFFALSFVIANVFLAWIIGAGELKIIVTDPPAQHLAGLTAILIFSFVFYLVFVRFREQACVLACPYGRVLSALTDARTITVTYDWIRGEPRGRIIHARQGDAGRAGGDCIDCHQCVTVCPTGIDIRDGIQLECVNCTACIDACDSVMDRVGRSPGLIRLTSHDAIAARAGTTAPAAATSPRRRWPVAPRAAAYAGVWLVLVITVATLLAGRRDLDVLILRQPGTLYATVAGGDVANFYDVQAFNRTSHEARFTIEVTEPRGATITTLGQFGEVAPFGVAEGRLLLRVPPGRLASASTAVRFVVRGEDGTEQNIESSFVGPATH